jgi:signal transduction histidine kinase
MLEAIAKLLIHLGDAVIVVDGEGRVPALVPEPLDILGAPPVLRGQPLPEHIAARVPLEPLLSGAREFNRFPLAHGERRFEIDAIALDAPETSRAVFLLVRDVTEKISDERKLIAQEKMAAVGLLAAGVAHEFNNILGAIYGYAQMAKRDESFREKLIDVVSREATTARTITGNLLSFSRYKPNEQSSGMITEVIDSVITLVGSELSRNNIEVVRDFKDVSETLLSQGGMEQVFLNLIINAQQAIGRNGTITVSVDVDGGDIVVCLSDTGRGIAPEHIGRVFEPFFTTKNIEKEEHGEQATGLGLSVSYNIIKDHAGDITVESASGQGTAFTIRLPVRKERRKKKVKVSSERRASELTCTRSARPAPATRRSWRSREKVSTPLFWTLCWEARLTESTSSGPYGSVIRIA